MVGYVLDGVDLSGLFDTSVNAIGFTEDPRGHIPANGSIIYSIWDRGEQFLYVGISGLQKSLEKRNPLSRIDSHRSGRRSGDQFCIYICDFYVVPKLVEEGNFTPRKGLLDQLTRDYIQTNLSYRFVHIVSADSDAVVRNLETKIKSGVLGPIPILNGAKAPGV